MGVSELMGITPDTLAIIIIAIVAGIWWFIRKITSLEVKMATVETKLDAHIEQSKVLGGKIMAKTFSKKKNYIEAFSAILGAISFGIGISFILMELKEISPDKDDVFILFIWPVLGGFLSMVYGLEYKWIINKIPKIVLFIGLLFGWSFAIFILYLMVFGT